MTYQNEERLKHIEKELKEIRQDFKEVDSAIQSLSDIPGLVAEIFERFDGIQKSLIILISQAEKLTQKRLEKINNDLKKTIIEIELNFKKLKEIKK